MRAVPHHKRTGWICVKQSGVQASQLFSGLYFPAVVLALGWTGAALGGAVVCVLLWLVSLKYVPSPAQLAQRQNTAPEPPEVTVDTGRLSTVDTKDKLPPLCIFSLRSPCSQAWVCRQPTSIFHSLPSRSLTSPWYSAGWPLRYLGLSAWSHASPGADACKRVPNHPAC